jgi:hypothetical protein
LVWLLLPSKVDVIWVLFQKELGKLSDFTGHLKSHDLLTAGNLCNRVTVGQGGQWSIVYVNRTILPQMSLKHVDSLLVKVLKLFLSLSL